MRRQQLIKIALVAIALFILFRVTKIPASSGEEWTVYGSKGCGWTVKQLNYMKRHGKPYKFVDCEKGGCSGMDAFPTLVSPDGEKIVGYKEI